MVADLQCNKDMAEDHSNTTASGEDRQQRPANLPTLNAAIEKPLHYTYLKDFRVEACPLFKQHQCQQHRPYTCFYWHFANQRRRRPVRKRDGTFNYSPDIYCTKYDENTGVCPDGDECVYLHRVAGDVERKYHLRYYKTASCVHQTDVKGHCAKNGQHCAFAHSPDDVRLALYDIRELQTTFVSDGGAQNTPPTQQQPAMFNADSKDRTSFVVEDPVWQDQEHVLSCYKTEACRKPARLCRQGYACPFFHNAKDRRRPPALIKYRSTPCPNAKQADEWVDADGCEGGEQCSYCHSRTEQQFHPEIYKSTKCNDMLQHGYCPRGPFCAFAHNDHELHAERHLHAPSTEAPKKQAADANNLFNHQLDAVHCQLGNVDLPEAPVAPASDTLISPSAIAGGRSGGRRSGSVEMNPPVGSAPSYSSVLKHRTASQSSGTPVPVGPGAAKQPAGLMSSSYPRAPGFERHQHSPPRTWTPDLSGQTRVRTASLGQQVAAMDLGWPLSAGYTVGSNEALGSSPLSTSFGAAFPMRRNELMSCIEDTHSSGDELQLPPISERDEGGSTAQGIQSLMRSQQAAQPMAIPGANVQQQVVQFSQSSSGGGGVLDGGSLPTAAQLFGSSHHSQFNMSGSFPNEGLELDQTALLAELQRTNHELHGHRAKVAAWEDGLKQARQACEAWKKEAEAYKARASVAETERVQLKEERDLAVNQVVFLRAELARLQKEQQRSKDVNGFTNTFDQLLLQLQSQQQQQRTVPVPVSLAAGPNVTGPMCARCGRNVSQGGGCSFCSGGIQTVVKSVNG